MNAPRGKDITVLESGIIKSRHEKQHARATCEECAKVEVLWVRSFEIPCHRRHPSMSLRESIAETGYRKGIPGPGSNLRAQQRMKLQKLSDLLCSSREPLHG